MRGPHINEFGDVVSSNLDLHENLSADKHLFNDMSLSRGQIQSVYAIDDAQNDPGQPGNITLYDVMVYRPDGGTENIRRCRAMQPLFGGGLNNFFEVLPTDPGPEAKNHGIPAILKRGSHVLVGFISGQRAAGVILGTLPHPNKAAIARRPKKALGTHLEGEFQGLNWKIKNDGSMDIVFNGPRNDTGTIVSSSGPTSIGIDASGNVKVKTNAEQSISIDRTKKEIQVINGTTTWTMDKTKITAESDYFEVRARKDVSVKADGKAMVRSKGEATVSSDAKIKLAKGDKEPDEPFVLGKVFVKFAQELLQALATHTHTGNMGFPTLPPTQAAKFTELMNSPIADEKVLSKHIIGEK